MQNASIVKNIQVNKFDLFANDNSPQRICALNFAVDVGAEVLQGRSAQAKSILLVLDISGSMAGAPLTQAKQALNELVGFLCDNNLGQDITFITFNTETNVISCAGRTREQIAQIINMTQAGGGTDFIKCFTALTNWFNSHANQNAGIVFFTDGLDGFMQQGYFGPVQAYNPAQRKEQLAVALQTLRTTIAKKSLATEVHSLGFSKDHDAVLLESITSCGTVKGNFRFIPETSMISEGVRSVCENITDTNVSATLAVQFHQQSRLTNYPIYLLSTEEVGRFTGYVFLPVTADTVQSCTLQIKVGKNEETHVVVPNAAPQSAALAAEDNIRLIEALVMYTKERVLKHTTAFGRNDPQANIKQARLEVEFLSQQLEAARERIHKITAAVMQLGRGAIKVSARDTRKRLLTLCGEASDLLSQFYNALLTNKFTNAEIATITTLAYKNINKQGLRKKMDQRLSENEEKLRADDVEIEKYVAQLDFAALAEQRRAELEEAGTCLFSHMNFLEAMQEGSCLCLGVDISRPEAAIADASQVRVNGIASSLISDTSFDEALEFTLRKNNGAGPSIAFAKGTMGADDAILVGSARERITAVMPLYLCPEHWTVARKRMKWCLGFLATADKLGYTFQQMTTVPFLVLYKVVQDWLARPSEHTNKILQLVLRTCRAIIEDFKLEITTMTDYSASTAARTKDVRANNALYCAQLLALNSTTQADTRRFCLALCEEELRRHAKELDDAMLFTILGGPLARNLYVVPHVEAFTKEQERNALEQTRRMSSGLGQGIRLSLGMPAMEATVDDLINFNQAVRVTDPLDTLEKDYILNCNSILPGSQLMFEKYCRPLMEFLYGTKLVQAADVPIELLKMAEDPLQVVAMLIQNSQHIKNMVRSASMAEGKYWDFLCPVVGAMRARQYLYDMLRTLIKQMRAAECAAVAVRFAANISGDRAGIFARTDDIYEAAGALKDAMQGTNLMTFVRALYYNSNVPLIKEKIRMLLTGQFRGIKLIADVSREAVDGYIVWRPCKQNRNRLMRAANLTFTEWDLLKIPE